MRLMPSTRGWAAQPRAACAAVGAALLVAVATACSPTYTPPPPDPRVALDVGQPNAHASAAHPVDPRAPTPTSVPLVSPATPTPAPGDMLSEPDAVARVLPAVLRIVADRSIGTGVIVSADGVAITAAHVVGDHKSVKAQLQDGREFTATVEWADQWVDVARLKLPARGLPVAPLGDPARLRLGEPLMAVGYALDLPGGPSVTRGVFSAHRRGKREVDYIQTDTALNPGNSGGPLISLRGEVIGINSWLLREREGVTAREVNFAVSGTELRPLLARNG
ncbi:MAG TPA: trypsin-like peptidase domain-containing protein [Chloroflexota bacterium]|nr:trypsin-like peptidase domain-containing protein [Chloroflexota bacterium]